MGQRGTMQARIGLGARKRRGLQWAKTNQHQQVCARRRRFVSFLQGSCLTMATTTFGYNPVEDRVWMACSLWQHERLWMTRRCAQEVTQAVCRVLEQSAAGAPEADAPTRAAAEHDAAINRPSVSGPSMQTGRDDGAQAAGAPAVHYRLCTAARVSADAQEAALSFQTPGGELAIVFDREGLHRWLRGMYMVLQHANWNLPPLPDWVTRSYLPPALRALLIPAAPGSLPDDDAPDEEPPA